MRFDFSGSKRPLGLMPAMKVLKCADIVPLAARVGCELSRAVAASINFLADYLQRESPARKELTKAMNRSAATR